MPSTLLRHDNYALRLGQATGALHVHVTITGRRWFHNLFRGLAWEREWAGVIADRSLVPKTFSKLDA